MFCSAIASRTSLRPSIPIAMAPTPNAIRITLATIPPYANTCFIVLLLSSAVTMGRASRERCCGGSAAPLKRAAGNYRIEVRLEPEPDVDARAGRGARPHGVAEPDRAEWAPVVVDDR